jgi:hypothetical protein
MTVTFMSAPDKLRTSNFKLRTSERTLRPSGV